ARRASTDVTHRRFLRALVGDYGRYVAHVVRDREYESFRRVDLVESGFPLLDFARDTAHDYDFGCIEVFFERDEQSGVHVRVLAYRLPSGSQRSCCGVKITRLAEKQSEARKRSCGHRVAGL